MILKEAKTMLREAGYTVTSSTHGSYIHTETGHKLNLYTYANGRQNWQKWLEAGHLPTPPRVVANRRGTWWQIQAYEEENGRRIEFSHLPREMGAEDAIELARAILEISENVL